MADFSIAQDLEKLKSAFGDFTAMLADSQNEVSESSLREFIGTLKTSVESEFQKFMDEIPKLTQELQRRKSEIEDRLRKAKDIAEQARRQAESMPRSAPPMPDLTPAGPPGPPDPNLPPRVRRELLEFYRGEARPDMVDAEGGIGWSTWVHAADVHPGAESRPIEPRDRAAESSTSDASSQKPEPPTPEPPTSQPRSGGNIGGFSTWIFPLEADDSSPDDEDS